MGIVTLCQNYKYESNFIDYENEKLLKFTQFHANKYNILFKFCILIIDCCGVQPFA